MGAPLDNMFMHAWMWPIIILGLIYTIYINVRDTRANKRRAEAKRQRDEKEGDTPTDRMDYDGTNVDEKWGEF